MLDVQRFIEVRPYAWHLTARSNLERIRETRVLESARRLIAHAREGLTHVPRRQHRVVRVSTHDVVLRDQAPLHEGHIALEPGWDFARFVDHLNSFVFFWPGRRDRAVDSGARHFQRYWDKGEPLAVLRVETRDLLRENASPRFSACNSGSPRANAGRKQPRGNATFREAREFERTAAGVVELVFEGVARLPGTTEWSTAPDRPFARLFG